jgi:hypothetical protein
MRRSITLVLAACAVAAAPVQSHAQGESELAAWIGLITTPVGAFTPLAPTPRSAQGRTPIGVQARYSHWQFDEDDDNTNNFGAGLVIGRGPVRAALELGWRTVKDCGDCGHVMGGVDVEVGLLERTLDGAVTLGVALNPALGFARPGNRGNEITTLAGALSVPISLSIPAGAVLRVVPFVSPGFGVGRVSGGGESSTGSRAMLAGGLAVGGLRAPVQLTASARKVLIADSPTVLGLGLSLGR